MVLLFSYSKLAHTIYACLSNKKTTALLKKFTNNPTNKQKKKDAVTPPKTVSLSEGYFEYDMARRQVVSSGFAGASKRARSSVRHQLQLSFPSENSRDSFLTRIERAKKRLFPDKGVDNLVFMSALLDRLDAAGGATEQEQHSSTVTSASMLDSAGL